MATGFAIALNEITRPRIRPTNTAGRARPQPVVPGRAQTPAAASTVTMKVRPVLVTTSSIVMYRVVVAAYGDGAAYGSYWVGAPYGCAWVAHGPAAGGRSRRGRTG